MPTVFRPREAVLSVGLYLLLGAIGLPVFAGGGAGFHALIGPTAGYLWFYLVYSGLTSSLTNSDSGFVRIFSSKSLRRYTCLCWWDHWIAFPSWNAIEKALAVGYFPLSSQTLVKLLLLVFISRPLLQRLKNQAYFAN